MSDVFLWDKDIREKKTQVMEQFCKKKKKWFAVTSTK